MAVRIDASGDKLYRTANLPARTAFTLAGWAYRHSNRTNQFQYYAGLEDATSNASGYLLLGWSDSNVMDLSSNGGNTNFANSGPTIGTWYYWFIRSNGTNSYQAGWKPVGGSWTTVTVNATLSWTAAVLYLGNDSYDEWCDISLERARVWDAELSTTELDSEMASATVVRTSNLRMNWPLTVHTDLTDISGNGYNLTAAGTLSTFLSGLFPDVDVIPALLRHRRHFVIDSWR